MSLPPNRAFAAAVAAALALPVLALAALIGEQEQARTHATIVTVPLIGYDPRDLLRGHYLNSEFDWDWQEPPTATTTGDTESIEGGLCVLPGEAAKPRVRFLLGWTKGDGSDAGCRATIAGRVWKRGTGLPARFTPTALDESGGGLKLFVPEKRALALEEIMRDRPGALSVDLAIRADGHAAIGALRVDGQPLGGKPPGR